MRLVEQDFKRWERFAREPRAVMPPGYTAPLEFKTTRQRINERLSRAVKPSRVSKTDVGQDLRETILNQSLR